MNLFNPQERDAVEDKWGMTPLYDMAESVCNRCLASCLTLRLHPSELLYQCLYIIDSLRGMSRQRGTRWAEEQYSELSAYIRDRQTGASNADIDTNVAAILHTTACWLLDAGGWFWAAQILEEQIALHSNGSTAALVKGFEEYLEESSMWRQQFMTKYMRGTSIISQEIEDMLNILAEQCFAGQTGTTNIYNINHDFVQQKNVQNEVNGVSSGGIGIRNVNSE